jgi:hypothetical protein
MLTRNDHYRMDGSTESADFLSEAAGANGFSEAFDAVAFNEYFGLCTPEDLVVIRPYIGDEDDRVLNELRPKYIIMYDPDPAFVRRIEVGFLVRKSNEKLLSWMFSNVFSVIAVHIPA